MQNALLNGDPTASSYNHPRYQETPVTTTNVPAEFYCLETKQQVCKFCAKSEFYRHKKCISLTEAVEMRVRELRAETDKCRQLAGEMRGLVVKYMDCADLDKNLYNYASEELKHVRDAIYKLVDDKFTSL